MGKPAYRAVLALHTGAVESEGGDAVADPLDVKDAFVAPLARLRLWQVLGFEGDGLHLPRRDQNLLGAHQLWTVLQDGHKRTLVPNRLLNNHAGYDCVWSGLASC